MKQSQIKSVVVIDDSKNFADTLSYQLERNGYKVHSFSTVEAARTWSTKKHDSPTFILADRELDGYNIDTTGIDALRFSFESAIIVVYTNLTQLSPIDQQELLNLGVRRVLDRQDIANGAEDIIRELDELAAVIDSLRTFEAGRSKILSALIGSDVGLSIVDRRHQCWFANTLQEGSMGRRCSGGTCWLRAHELPSAFGPCWGCTVEYVTTQHKPVEKLYLAEALDHTLKWVKTRSEPIEFQDGGRLSGARVAITEISYAELGTLSYQVRLSAIAQSLVHAGLGRVRIYTVNAREQLTLAAAASAAENAFRGDSIYYRELHNVNQVPISYSRCPYARKAHDLGTGLVVPDWSEFGRSPFADDLGLDPPYLLVPIFGADGKLCAWLSADFRGLKVGMDEAAKAYYTRDVTPSLLQQTFGGEIQRAIAAPTVNRDAQTRLTLAAQARLQVGSAPTTEAAMEVLLAHLKELFPGCGISVRMLGGEELVEDPRLSFSLDGAVRPDMRRSDPQSLAALVVRERRPVFLSDYDKYREQAERDGRPKGYPPPDTLSTAHIPLTVEQEVFGSLSVDSSARLSWEDGYEEAIRILASLAALVFRDIVLDSRRDAMMNERTAKLAYSAAATAGIFRKIQSSIALFRAGAAAENAARQVREQKDAREIGNSLEDIKRAIIDANFEPSQGMLTEHCSLDEVWAGVRALLELKGDMHGDGSKSPRLAISAEDLEVILQILIAYPSEGSGMGSFWISNSETGGELKLDWRKDGTNTKIRVQHIGLSIPDEVAIRVFRDPPPPYVWLLVAKGAALSCNGDLTLDEYRQDVVLTLTIPQVG